MRIEFWDRSRTYVGEYYNDRETLAAADDVPVTEGLETPGIDAQLEKAGRLAGRVSNEAGEWLSGVWVTAYRPDGDGGWDYAADTSTDRYGRYSIRGLRASDYRIGFDPNWRSDYAPEFWDDARTVFGADDVSLAAGQTVTGLDAVLSRGGEITGTVTEEGGGTLQGIGVVAYASDAQGNWHYHRDTSTDATGQYVIDGLSEGRYRVRFFDAAWELNRDLLPEWWDDARARATPRRSQSRSAQRRRASTPRSQRPGTSPAR